MDIPLSLFVQGMLKSHSSDSMKSSVSSRYSSPSSSLASRRGPVDPRHNYFTLEKQLTEMPPRYQEFLLEDMEEEDVKTDEEEARSLSTASQQYFDHKQAEIQQELEMRMRCKLVDQEQSAATDRSSHKDQMEMQYEPDTRTPAPSAAKQNHSTWENGLVETEDIPPTPPPRKFFHLEKAQRELQRRHEVLEVSVPKYQSQMTPDTKALPRGQAPQQYYKLEKGEHHSCLAWFFQLLTLSHYFSRPFVRNK